VPWVFRAVIGLLWVLVLVSFWVFLGCFVFGFWLGYLCILSCVLRGACAFFDIYNIIYQKKGSLCVLSTGVAFC
jgi:hypothetical protein